MIHLIILLSLIKYSTAEWYISDIYGDLKCDDRDFPNKTQSTIFACDSICDNVPGECPTTRPLGTQLVCTVVHKTECKFPCITEQNFVEPTCLNDKEVRELCIKNPSTYEFYSAFYYNVPVISSAINGGYCPYTGLLTLDCMNTCECEYDDDDMTQCYDTAIFKKLRKQCKHSDINDIISTEQECTLTPTIGDPNTCTDGPTLQLIPYITCLKEDVCKSSSISVLKRNGCSLNKIIIGISVGCGVFLLIVISGLVFYFYRRYKKNEKVNTDETIHADEEVYDV
jgi:hypothetical protein